MALHMHRKFLECDVLIAYSLIVNYQKYFVPLQVGELRQSFDSLPLHH